MKDTSRDVAKLVKVIPEGYSIGFYRNRKYGMSKKNFNQGQSVKLYAEQLGGTDFISLNFYATSSKQYLKPCEMSTEKVLDFLQNVELTNE